MPMHLCMHGLAALRAQVAFPLEELKHAGFKAIQLRAAGFTAKQLEEYGFTVEEFTGTK